MSGQKSAVTKGRILASATELFYKNGFEATTFTQIAKKSGVTQPAIYSYFADKMDILVNVIAHSAEQGRLLIDNKVSERDSALHRLKNYLEANLEFFSSEKADAHSIMAAFYFGISDQKVGLMYQQLRERTIERLEVLILQGIREGAFKLANPRLAAQAVYSNLVGACYEAIYLPKELKLRDLKNRTWKTTEKCLND
ncbi:MAG: TetR/AcrR family transcriptional regulator [Pseudobdellovibrionaceae bacterium]